MKTKNKYSIAQKRRWKKQKNSLRLRIAMAQILVLSGLLVAGCAMAYQIKLNKITTIRVEAIQCENGKFSTDCSLIDTEWSGATASGSFISSPKDDEAVEYHSASSISGIMKSCISASITLEQRKENWEKVKKIAEDNDFKWISYLKLLADCEGEFNEFSVNCINPGGGIDRGAFQINSKWHPEVSDECAFNLKCATEWTIMRIENGYQYEWTCNEHILNKSFKLRFF